MLSACTLSRSTPDTAVNRLSRALVTDDRHSLVMVDAVVVAVVDDADDVNAPSDTVAATNDADAEDDVADGETWAVDSMR